MADHLADLTGDARAEYLRTMGENANRSLSDYLRCFRVAALQAMTGEQLRGWLVALADLAEAEGEVDNRREGD